MHKIVSRMRMWRHGILLGFLLAIAGSFSASYAQAGQLACGANEESCRVSGGFSAVSVDNPTLPGVTSPSSHAFGALVYSDFKQIEAVARASLDRAIKMRESISPYRGKNDFTTYLRNLDFKAGWTQPYGGNTPYDDDLTFQQLVDAVEKDLTEARQIYAFLIIYAPEARFRADGDYTAVLCGVEDKENPNPPASTPGHVPGQVLAPIIDWCNFRARLRQSIREIANIRIIVGQEFMVDALGVNFSGNIPGGEELVRKEIGQLQAALLQFKTAERYLTSALTQVVDNGCTVSDFYTRSDWALLARTLELQGSVQYQIATRLSYLDMDSAESVQKAKTASLNGFRQSANDGYIDLLALAGAGPSDEQDCDFGDRANGLDIETLAINVLGAQQKMRDLVENRNIFGFDVAITPARHYKSSAAQTCDTNPEGDTGLWDQANCLAEIAKDLQEREENKTRQFDESQEKLHLALNTIRTEFDTKIDDVTSCDRSQMATDEEFNSCVDGQIVRLKNCLALVTATAEFFDPCVEVPLLIKNNDGTTALSDLRRLYLEWLTTVTRMENYNARIKESRDANAKVQDWLYKSGLAETVARASQASVDATACLDVGDPLSGLIKTSICGSVSFINFLAQSAAGALSTQADVEIAGAENKKEVENLLLDQSELSIAADAAARAFLSKQSDVNGMLGVLERTFAETKRQRAYFATLPANDPSFRIVRDFARIELAEALEKAAKIAYLAARRAEYEYAARLYTSGFHISDIYRARTAQDIIKFLSDLKTMTNSLAGGAYADTTAVDLKISIARHVLHLTDAVLISQGYTTPQAIESARTAEFRKWVAQHTVPNTFESPKDMKPVLIFTMTTSLLDDGLYAHVIPQGYDRYWHFTLAGVGRPKASSNGVSINLVSNQAGLSHRTAVMTQSGLVHMRSLAGCVFDYKLVAPAALLGLEWAENQDPTKTTGTFKANINQAHAYTENGFRSESFEGRTISATGWEIMVFAGSPDNILPDMNLQQLTDIELNLSAVYSSRVPGTPEASDCARMDW